MNLTPPYLNLPELSPPWLCDEVGRILCQGVKSTCSTVRIEVIARVDAGLQSVRYLMEHELVGVRSDGQVLHDYT